MVYRAAYAAKNMSLSNIWNNVYSKVQTVTELTFDHYWLGQSDTCLVNKVFLFFILCHINVLASILDSKSGFYVITFINKAIMLKT